MIEILFTKYAFTKEKLEKEAKAINNGSHIFAINHLYQKMGEKERFKAIKFQREIGKLKNKRENADYHDVVIDESFSREALSQAKEINTILFDVYKLEV